MKEEPLDESVRELLRQFFEEHIPFNRYVGMKLVSVAKGVAHGELPFRDELVGDPMRPALHGGVLSAFADATGGLAVFTVIEPGAKCSTIDLRIDYLRPGRLEKIQARARVLRTGNRVAVVEVSVFQHDPDAPIAIAMAVYSIKR